METEIVDLGGGKNIPLTMMYGRKTIEEEVFTSAWVSGHCGNWSLSKSMNVSKFEHCLGAILE